MNCGDVERELAAPTADRDATALADHLASCPSCALWAGRIEDFDRIWNAGRPVLPSETRWQTLWAEVHEQLAVPVLEPARAVAAADEVDSLRLVGVSRAWRRRGVLAFSLAQAAALLLAFAALLTQEWTPAVASTPRIDIDSGQIVVIRDDGEVVRQAAIDPSADPSSFDDTFAMFNALEAMAE